MSDESPKAPVSTNFIFVDRRNTGRGKSSSNRQKLLKRIKDSIRNAKPEDIDAGGVHKGGSAHGANSYTNPVKVARHALNEPTLSYDHNSGEREIVLIGNDTWLKGDEFPLAKSGKGRGGRGSGNGPGESGEDDFIINISRSEFYDVFFEDCELPDLKENHEKDLPEHVMQRAGFQKIGNPGQLSVIRSFKHSLARRLALTHDSREELEDLEAELVVLMSDNAEHESTDAWAIHVQKVTTRIAELKQKIGAVGLYEDVDLRYRKSERVQVKASDAVLAMIMDISGSMDEEKKRMARKFFTLQYAFIAKKYPQTDLIFIAHTDEAEEMTEEDFFTTRKSGGTVVSPAWALLHKIIKERYDADQTNIYVSYAGDGDNWDSDNKEVIAEIEESGFLSKVRHVVYVQVGESFASGYGSGPSLWNVMKSISSNSNSKLMVIKIGEESQVFDAFKVIYKKRGTKK
ncbi:DUF444 family protein [Acinetobacter sp.]|uniref:DUF444 family protein n=1 Tax=Acinetobacter sp. TaxID=472 RepID=UPI003890A20D